MVLYPKDQTHLAPIGQMSNECYSEGAGVEGPSGCDPSPSLPKTPHQSGTLPGMVLPLLVCSHPSLACGALPFHFRALPAFRVPIGSDGSHALPLCDLPAPKRLPQTPVVCRGCSLHTCICSVFGVSFLYLDLCPQLMCPLALCLGHSRCFVSVKVSCLSALCL